MSVKDLISNIKHNGLLSSMHLLDKLYQEAIDIEEQLAESHRALRAETTAHENTQMQLEKVAAENGGLKGLIEQHANSVAVCPNCSHEEPSETDDIVALYRSMQSPATDAFLAEVRASVVDEVCMKIHNETSNYYQEGEISGLEKATYICDEFAAQLRKGVQS